MQNSIIAENPTDCLTSLDLAQLFEELHRHDIKRLLLLLSIVKAEPDAFVGLNMTREQAKLIASLSVSEITSLVKLPVSKPLFGLAISAEEFANIKHAMNDDLSMQLLFNYVGITANG